MRTSLVLRGILLLTLLATACGPSAATPAPKADSKPAEAAKPAPTSAPAKPAGEAKPAESKPAESKPTATGELRLGLGVIPSNMDYAFDTSALALFVYHQMYDALAVADEKGELQPALATEWKVLDDKLTWQFKLRQGVKFHNGEEFDAESVKLSVERIGDPNVKSNWSARVAQVDKVEVVDKYTVNIKTKRPWAVLLKDLLVVRMIPPKYYQQVGLDGFSQKPVGTGPFKLVEYDKLAHVKLSAAEDSWRGVPKVASVTFKRLPEASTRVAALEANEVDLIFDTPAEDVDRLKAKGFEFNSPNIAAPSLLILNTKMDSPLRNQKVRQAMNYAVDKESIVKNLLLGYGRVLDGQTVGPDGYGYNPDLKPYPYDPDRAKQLLAEAGFPNGFSMNFDATEGRYPKDKEFSEAIVAQMAKVGITLEMKIVDANVFIQRYARGDLGPVHIVGLQYLPSMDMNQGLPGFTSTSPQAWLNDPKFDELYNAQASELDPAARLKKLHELSAYMRDIAPVIFLHQFQSIYGLSKSVEGFTPRADYNAELEKVSVKR